MFLPLLLPEAGHICQRPAELLREQHERLLYPVSDQHEVKVPQSLVDKLLHFVRVVNEAQWHPQLLDLAVEAHDKVWVVVAEVGF